MACGTGGIGGWTAWGLAPPPPESVLDPAVGVQAGEDAVGSPLVLVVSEWTKCGMKFVDKAAKD